MKKSTLFFKVMVLMALLVPWTSWGQIAPIAGDDGIWGHGPTIYINDVGQISTDGKTYSNNVTIQFSDVQDQNEGNWEFGKEIEPDNLPITVTPSKDGKQVTLAVEEGTKVSDITAVKFHIAALNNGGQRKGWIEFGLIAGKTNISDEESITISINGGSDSKIYDGEAISISVTTTDGTSLVMGTDYQVYIDDNTTAIATEAGLPKNVKGDTEAAYSIVIEGIGDDYCGKTEAKEVTIKKRSITVTLKDSPKLEFKIGDAATNLNAEDYASYFNIQENITDAGLAKNEYAKVSGTFSVNTESAREVDIDTESLSLVDKDNSGFNATNYNITWGGDSGLKVTVSKKDFSDIESGGTISVTQDGKTYDGTAISAPEVKDGETVLKENEDYTVKYKDNDGKELDEAPSDAGSYTVVITPTKDGDYENSPIEKPFTIAKAKVTVTGSLTITEGDKLEDSYKFADIAGLNADGIIEGEEETVKAAITITPRSKENPTASEDAFTITLAETVGNYEISEDSKIALVVEEDSDKWQDGDAKAEVTVYVNENGKITKYGETEAENNQASISIGSFTDLSGWTFDYKLIDGKPTSQPELDPTGDNTFSWNVVGSYDILIISGTDATIEEGETVKVKVKKGNEEGYLLVTFAKDESTEEPEPEGEWNEGEAKASITVTVNTLGLITKVNNMEVSDDHIASITIGSLGEEESMNGWIFSYKTDEIGVTSQAVIDPEEENSFAWNSVGSNSTLKISGTDATIENNETVRVKIENSTSNIEGYVLVTFVKENTTITAEDITEGGETSGEEGEIDNVLFTADGAKSIYYDGNSHGFDVLKATIDGIEVTLTEGTDYTVTYKENSTDEPVDAGSYTATITFKEDAGYSGTIELPIEISPRPITLYFSFEEGILEGEEFVLGENVFIDVKEGSFAEGEKAEFDELIEKGIISAKFALGETQSDGTVEVKLVSFNYPAGEVSGYDLKYSNYDPKLLTGHVKEHGEGGTETELPDAGEAGEDGTIDYPGEGDSGVIVGDVDIIDEETGIGGSGINYRQYELKFCETDFFPNLNDYEVEGLKLFSRHNKFYTKANGSFTIWYEKDGVKNGEYGDYRIYISRNGADGDYSELKLDEVSDYFQIRNVNSDIWVRIYYGTGFPVANEEITATDARAYAQANKIVVITPEPTDVQIISMAGAVVATDQVTGQREFANLAEGVYIVRMGETVIKLQVRN